MLTDLEIAERAELKPIAEVAKGLGIAEKDLRYYGRYIAKTELPKIRTSNGGKKKGRLILVTAMNPTKSGEGKTTVSIGLADALNRLGKKAALALREPSLGPVFGIKGGAAGGGYSQIAPMDEINLHFTGDFNAVEKANNLLCAAIDNDIFFEAGANIDPSRVMFKRCTDMNDRALRNINLNVDANGGRRYERRDGFNITAASEIMAALCLADGLPDLKKRIGNIAVGYDRNGGIVRAERLMATDAAAILLSKALLPNLVQSLEGTPAFVHGGPFANIAHGCNSLIATREAMSRADYTVTEAGFGADLGAEKFIDIKCRAGDLDLHCAVLVATVKALRLNGGVPESRVDKADCRAVRLGLSNLKRHADNLINVFGLPVVVALNRFPSDTKEEIDEVRKALNAAGIAVFESESFAKGGAGALELAEYAASAAERFSGRRRYCYELGDSYIDKIEKVAFRIYRAEKVVLSDGAKRQLAEIEDAGFGGLPVCIAKTQYSFSDDPLLLGAPEGFDFHINGFELRAGAGFIVALSGNMILMPALSRMPGYLKMSISDDGRIGGLS